MLFLFLSAILVAGTFAAIFPLLSPSSLITAVYALSDYGLKDDNNYNSKYLPYKKDNVKCNNFNLNVNGLNVNAIPKSLESLAAQASDAEGSQTGDIDIGSSTFGNGENRFGSYNYDDDNKKNFAFVCISNNDNEQVSPTPPTPPPTGFLDLVTANYLSDDVSILLNNGDGTFAPKNFPVVSEEEDFPLASGPRSVAVGDFDNDGNLDLATADENSDSVSILLRNDDGTFGPPTSYDLGGKVGGAVYIAVGDFDNDGNLDLVTANELSHTVSILLNNDDGTFTQKAPPDSPIMVGKAPRSVAVGDFDNDGNLDLATANYDSNSVSILLGNGDGTFPENPPEVMIGGSPVSVAVGDFNGDNVLDLAAVNLDSNTVSILLGKGAGTFSTNPPTVPVGDIPTSVAVGDFDNDGNLDLAVANGDSNTVSILLGNVHGTFDPANGSTVPVGSGPRSVTVGDFDNDGNLDLATANEDSNDVSIRLGNGHGTFDPANGSTVPVGSEPRSITVGIFN